MTRRRLRAVVERGSREHRDVFRHHLDGEPRVVEHLGLQEPLVLQFRRPVAATPPEMALFGRVQRDDDVPRVTIAYGNSGQNLIWRGSVVVAAFIDEEKACHGRIIPARTDNLSSILSSAADSACEI